VSEVVPQVLLAHHLKALRLPSFLREHDKLARRCAAEGVDHTGFLLRLAELELLDREGRMVERRIRQARFPAVKGLDGFDFPAIPSLNKMLVLELARCEYVERRENVIALGNSGTGKTHVALGLGLAACQKGMSVGFTTAAALVHELLEARDEKRLLRLQKQLAAPRLLIIDELGYVPLSSAGRGGAAVRGVQPALRARLDPGHQQPALRRVDGGVRRRAPDGRPARPAHPPRPHPGDERRKLPPEGQPPQAARRPRSRHRHSLTRRSGRPPQRSQAPAMRYTFCPPRRYTFSPLFTPWSTTSTSTAAWTCCCSP